MTIFDNNHACKTNLIDAINDGVLPNPTYVTSLYSLDEEISKISSRLNKEEEDYTNIVDKLDKLKDWNSSTGIPTILESILMVLLTSLSCFVKMKSFKYSM